MRSQKWLKGFLTLAALGGIAFFLIPYLQPLQADDNQDNKHQKNTRGVPVHATVLKAQKLVNTLAITGTVMPGQKVSLKTEASGKITKLPLKEGDKVEKGATLMQINNAELQARLKQAKNRKKLLNQQVQRKKQLLAKSGISQESYDETKTELESLKAEIELIKAQIRKTEITAPFAGILGLKHVSLGSYVSPATPVVNLVQKQPVKIEFAIPGKYAKNIRKGEQIRFTTDGIDSMMRATIYAVEPAINIATRTLSVRALYPNKKQQLVPGSFVEIDLDLSTDPDALMVPAIALVPELQGKKVFVYQNGESRPRKVETGQRTDTHVQVTSGLSAGDTVITKGIQKLKPGGEVYIKVWDE